MYFIKLSVLHEIDCRGDLVVRASALLAGGHGFKPHPRQTSLKSASSDFPPWHSGLRE